MIRKIVTFLVLATCSSVSLPSLTPSASAQVFFPAQPVFVQPAPVFVQPAPVVWSAPRRVTTFYSPAPVVAGPAFVSQPAFPVVQAAPVTTFYAPPVRQTTFFAPAPVVVQPSPVFVSPGVVNSRTVYRRGWPVRSTTRWGW
ncbi:MAG: hypothetical protein SFX18_03610 [Pirellulales bacterium]|nr:hypothetical protein [Pirellulales bacterium]